MKRRKTHSCATSASSPSDGRRIISDTFGRSIRKKARIDASTAPSGFSRVVNWRNILHKTIKIGEAMLANFVENGFHKKGLFNFNYITEPVELIVTIFLQVFAESSSQCS